MIILKILRNKNEILIFYVQAYFLFILGVSCSVKKNSTLQKFFFTLCDGFINDLTQISEN
ncbi:hypothetical protein A7Q10_01985 [Methylacidiphilum caldifontis]|uniref:Uncharacterized protein n=1 Tax=Methylacidiphilum caldifontis TaxID=2795386 RepID=A0A4Y8P8J1_9BACT|nr:hypothetical protein A7Q10_01985 [Methylacidiphilum caldifontis]